MANASCGRGNSACKLAGLLASIAKPCLCRLMMLIFAVGAGAVGRCRRSYSWSEDHRTTVMVVGVMTTAMAMTMAKEYYSSNDGDWSGRVSE